MRTLFDLSEYIISLCSDIHTLISNEERYVYLYIFYFARSAR